MWKTKAKTQKMVLKISIYLEPGGSSKSTTISLGRRSLARVDSMCHFNPHSQQIALSDCATARIGDNRRLEGLGPLPVARAWIQWPKFQRKLTTLPNFFTSKLWAIIDGFIHVLYCYIQLSSSSQGPNRYFHSVFFPARRLAGNRGQVFSLSTFTLE